MPSTPVSHRTLSRAITIIALSALFSSILPAGEADPPELRQLHQECRRHGDLWTAIQLEAYAAAHPDQGRLSSNYLGRSQVVGDARFAFPHDIRNHWDRGSYVGVVAQRRFYRIADDGRPLQLSIPLPIWPARSTLSRDAQHLGLANASGRFNSRRLDVAVITTSGDTVWRRRVPLPGIPEGQNDGLRDRLIMANDGSALAAAIDRHPGSMPRVVLATGARQRLLPNLRDPKGLGPDGQWLIAHRDRQALLITPQGEQDIDDYAVGPGVALIRQGDDFFLVQKDGSRQPYTPEVAIGKNPGLWTVGDWLVIGSGHGAQQEAATDLLGNVIEDAGEQPYTLVLHRWDDLATDPASEAVMTIANTYSRCAFRPTTLYIWQAHELSLLDLSGKEPQMEPWLTSRAAIQGVWDHHHYTMVSHPEHKRSVFNNAGAELWHGECADAWVHSRRLALYRSDSPEGHRFTLVHLHDDPLQRKEVALPLDPGWWRIRTHPWRNLGIAENDDAWHRFDLDSGELLETVVKNPLVEVASPPWWHGENNAHGRFFRSHGRLFPKHGGPESLSIAEQLSTQDAFHAGRALLLLDARDEVLVYSRAQFASIGRAEADLIATDQQESSLVLTAGRQQQIVARLQRGPTLNTDLGPNPGQGKHLSGGDWRVCQRYTFTPPNATSLRWDSGKAGFEPRRLRSGGRDSLIVITDTVTILLEPRALPLVSDRLQ